MSIEKIISSLPTKNAAERKKMRDHAKALSSDNDPRKAADAQKLIAAIDDLEQSEHDQLVGELKGMPVEERVIRAFTVEPMSETEAKIIQVLLDNPGSTNRELSRKLGWNDNGFDLHFGMMCRDRSVYLWPAPDAEKRDGKFYSGILAEYDEDGSSFTMKPEVAAAFAKLGLKGNAK